MTWTQWLVVQNLPTIKKTRSMLSQCGWLTYNPSAIVFTCSTQYPSRWNGIYNPSLLVKKIHNFLCSPINNSRLDILFEKFFHLLQIPFQKQLTVEPLDMTNLFFRVYKIFPRIVYVFLYAYNKIYEYDTTPELETES